MRDNHLLYRTAGSSSMNLYRTTTINRDINDPEIGKGLIRLIPAITNHLYSLNRALLC